MLQESARKPGISATVQAGAVFIKLNNGASSIGYKLSIDAARVLSDAIGYAANDAERAQRETAAGRRDCMNCQHADATPRRGNACGVCLYGGRSGFPAWEPAL